MGDTYDAPYTYDPKPFRPDNLEQDQRLHALEQRVEELEALVDNLLGAAYDAACDEELPEYGELEGE